MQSVGEQALVAAVLGTGAAQESLVPALMGAYAAADHVVGYAVLPIHAEICVQVVKSGNAAFVVNVLKSGFTPCNTCTAFKMSMSSMAMPNLVPIRPHIRLDFCQ